MNKKLKKIFFKFYLLFLALGKMRNFKIFLNRSYLISKKIGFKFQKKKNFFFTL